MRSIPLCTSSLLLWLTLGLTACSQSASQPQARPTATAPAVSTANLGQLSPASYRQLAVWQQQAVGPVSPPGAIAQSWQGQPVGDLMVSLGQQLLGRPYAAGLLDQAPHETLLLDLTRFDCVLLVENLLAIARLASLGTLEPHLLARELQQLRYQGPDHSLNYCDRNHYFSDWLRNAAALGWLKNLTADLSDAVRVQQLDFMSHNSQLYAKLQDPTLKQCIVEQEQQRPSERLAYIPTREIRSISHQLRDGDIIGIATQIPGLDVTHVGLVQRGSDGQVGLLHASPAGSVVVAPDLARYASRVEGAIGIIVARPQQPSDPAS
jgi:hypothetical protein